MLWTSGSAISDRSTSFAIIIPCESEVLGNRRVSMSIDPSSSFGMNSVPRYGTDATDAISRTRAESTTTARWVRLQASEAL